jgi:hypothetical protein
MESDMHQVAELLKKEQNNPEAILEYSIFNLETKKDIPKAFQMLLNLLGTVKETNPIFKNIKYYMARVIKLAEPLDIILNLPFWKELTNNQHAAIYAWLGLIVKEYSGISQSMILLKKAILIFPDNHAYLLNLVYILEVDLRYTEALDLSLRLLNNTLPDFAFEIETGRLVSNLSNIKLIDKDLDLMSLIFNVIKILFLQGKLKHLKEWYDRVGVLIARSFSLTENLDYLGEYYKYIKELLKFLQFDKVQENKLSCKPLYVIGDSNCLSISYQTIEIDKTRRIFIPLLAHNLKISHLNDDSEHYAKYNYFNLVNGLRDQKLDYILVMFGSIDVRDNFDAIAEKGGRSESELINALTEIYLQRLKELSIFLRCCKVLICPVLPMLNLRDKFTQFNTEFKKRISSEKNNNLIYIGGFENDLASNKLKYFLDGQHSNPLWLSIVPYWNNFKI